VLWLGLSTGRAELLRLHDAVGQRLASAADGIAGTGNAGKGAGDAFSPHVTIARVRRDPPPGLGRALRDACARTPAPTARAEVHELTLFESVLKSRGPSYVPLVRVPLAGDTASR
jgi:2'-5' RNA ligase